jgi:hypothetical protein
MNKFIINVRIHDRISKKRDPVMAEHDFENEDFTDTESDDDSINDTDDVVFNDLEIENWKNEK